MEEFGKRLRKLRRARDWTQAELADRCSLLRKQISDYERGINRPSLRIADRLARTLDVTIDELVSNGDATGGTSHIEDPELLRLAQAIDKLPPAKREVVKTVLRTFVQLDRYERVGTEST